MTRPRLLVLTVAVCSLWNSRLFSQVQTRAERTNYVETSRYEDVVAFLETVAGGSRTVHNTVDQALRTSTVYPIARSRD